MARNLLIIFLLACTIAGCKAKKSPVAPQPYKYNVFYFQRASLFDQLPVTADDIIMLGNSLTNGGEWHELLGNPNVKNRGISADVIQGVYDRLDPIIKGKPKKIFLMIGVNDISHDLGADSIAEAYGKLIRHIRTQLPGTELYVQSCLPVNISFGMYRGMIDKSDDIVALNKLVQDMAPDLGFTWIDLYSRFDDGTGHMRRDLTNDGLHLLGPGYIVWRDAILPYIP